MTHCKIYNIIQNTGTESQDNKGEKMNRKDTLTALKIARKIGVTVNLIAPHGEAKSSTVKQYAKQEGMNYTEFRTGQAADAGDLTGLPEFELISRLDKDGNAVLNKLGQPDQYKVTTFVLPAWFPREENTLVFFDEVNRGAKDILNGVFEAILDYSMKGILMPKGCQIVTAMNPPTEDYSGTLDFDDKAWLDRFLHVKFQPSDAEFLEYYRSLYPNSAFVEFYADQPGMLRAKTASFDVGSLVTPSPRSTETALKLEQLFDAGEMDEGIFNEMLYGTIGSTVAIAAVGFKKTHIKSIKGKELIEKYHQKKVRDLVLNAIGKGRTDMLGLALKEIDDEFKARKGLKDQEALNVIEIVRDLSKSAEHQQTLVTMIAMNQNCTSNCKGFETVDNGTGLAYSKDLIEIRRPVYEAKVKAQEEMEKAKSKGKNKESEEVPF